MTTLAPVPSPVTHTTCPYCGVGCGVVVERDANGTLQVTGDKDHPANYGRLCSKGAALAETLGEAERLLYPEIAGQRVDWDSALNTVTQRFQDVIARHGPDAIAFYVSGQLLTEDYYVANKLMKGFIGSANIDTNSRLCMASSVAGHKRAFGADIVPCNYTDLEQSDLVVLVGSNTAWCHPVLFQRLRQAKTKRPAMRIVVIDPRRTATCDIADLHLPLKPGTDIALFNALLDYLERNGRLDDLYISQHTDGFAAALQAARQPGDPIQTAALTCDLNPTELDRFFQWFAETPTTVTVYSQGVNQWSCGTDKVNSIINLHLATGRIGRPGCGPFSFTGQPNAMGGREVGGLANQLAAHMDFTDTELDQVQRFWHSERMVSHPGLKAVDLFNAVADGRIKAIWIMATNPVVSLPDADRVKAALEQCEFVVVSDCIRETDTTRCADVLLPAATWGEKDGTVTNSERRISRQRAFCQAPGEAQPDWWIISQVAQRLGFNASFAYDSAAAIFCEHAALSGFENNGSRVFDISALANLDDQQYHALQPVQWPVTSRQPQGTTQLFQQGDYATPNGRARFVAVEQRETQQALSTRYPLVLNTGRIRDQWHTMTRTARTPRLLQHIAEPFVQVHPMDALAHQLRNGELAWVRSQWGEVLVRVTVSDEQRCGAVFIPMHWNDQFARRARVDAVVNPLLDPISGQPEFKHTPVQIQAYRHNWSGFLLSRQPLQSVDAEYCVTIRERGYWRYELAGRIAPTNWPDWVRQACCAKDSEGEWLEFHDPQRGSYRAACVAGDILQALVFIAPSPDALPGRQWPGSMFAEATLDSRTRTQLLAGRPGQAVVETGPTVCACFNVGRETLCQAIREHKLDTVEAIGAATKAGTNCGSCIPELHALLAEAKDTPQHTSAQA